MLMPPQEPNDSIKNQRTSYLCNNIIVSTDRNDMITRIEMIFSGDISTTRWKLGVAKLLLVEIKGLAK